MKIYKMNDVIDWVCANSEEEALKVYSEHLKNVGLGIIEIEESMDDACPKELTENEMNCLKYTTVDNDELTFREELAKRQQPEFFASTEF